MLGARARLVAGLFMKMARDGDCYRSGRYCSGKAMNAFYNLPLRSTCFDRFRRKRSAARCPRGRPGLNRGAAGDHRLDV